MTNVKLNSLGINYKTKVHLRCFIYYKYNKKSFEDQNLKLKLDLFNSYMSQLWFSNWNSDNKVAWILKRIMLIIGMSLGKYWKACAYNMISYSFSNLILDIVYGYISKERSNLPINYHCCKTKDLQMKRVKKKKKQPLKKKLLVRKLQLKRCKTSLWRFLKHYIRSTAITPSFETNCLLS